MSVIHEQKQTFVSSSSCIHPLRSTVPCSRKLTCIHRRSKMAKRVREIGWEQSRGWSCRWTHLYSWGGRKFIWSSQKETAASPEPLREGHSAGTAALFSSFISCSGFIQFIPIQDDDWIIKSPNKNRLKPNAVLRWICSWLYHTVWSS